MLRANIEALGLGGVTRIFRRDAAAMKVQQVVESEVRSAEDLNTEVKMLESMSLVQDVAAALSADDKQRQLTTFIFIQSQPLDVVKKAEAKPAATPSAV